MIGSSVIEALEGERVSLWIATAGCTPLGCTVEFDAADTTWDCPCHGSRFATDGTVIHGSAVDEVATKQLPDLE